LRSSDWRNRKKDLADLKDKIKEDFDNALG